MCGKAGAQLAIDRRHVRPFANHVGMELLADSPLVARDYYALPDSRQPVEERLDLTQLDANSADLNLGVRSPHHLDAAIKVVTRQVPGAVQPVARLERIGNEALPRELRLIEIADGHPSAANVDLANDAHRYRLHAGIQDMAAGVGDGPPDRHRARSRGRRAQLEAGSVVAGLRRSVEISESNVG